MWCPPLLRGITDIIPSKTYNGRYPLNVNAGKILPWFGRKWRIVEKLKQLNKYYFKLLTTLLYEESRTSAPYKVIPTGLALKETSISPDSKASTRTGSIAPVNTVVIIWCAVWCFSTKVLIPQTVCFLSLLVLFYWRNVTLHIYHLLMSHQMDIVT